jgi:hypothetical protein
VAALRRGPADEAPFVEATTNLAAPPQETALPGVRWGSGVLRRVELPRHGVSQIERRDDIPWGADHDQAAIGARVAEAFASVQPDLIRYLRALVGRDVAEDVASQVWVEVVAGAAGFRGDPAAFRRWVFATARRRGLDHRRRWWHRALRRLAYTLSQHADL